MRATIDRATGAVIEIQEPERFNYAAPLATQTREEIPEGLELTLPAWFRDGRFTMQPPADVVAAQEAATLAAAKANQTATVRDACQAAIYEGFESSALGAPHTYPAKPQDQSNLTGSVVSSLLLGVGDGWVTPFWCADASGAWAYAPHTAAQIQQVGADGKAAILAALGKCQALQAAIAAAPDVAAVQALDWA